MKLGFKKGQDSLTVGAVPAIVLTLILIGFYLSFGTLIMHDLGETTRTGITVTTTNQSLGTVVNNTAVTFLGSGVRPTGYAVVQVTNDSTAGKLVGSGNYTFTYSGAIATFKLVKSEIWNNTALHITYTHSYDAESLATNASSNAEEALNTFSSRLPLLALVIFFAVILTVIALLAATGRISM